ncbi:SMI1 / KNR4 family (SUKH-1) [Mesorhizobium sp. NFR06]|uniref:SMI1/KNR4 family protein n=1 Tax=Mesorhizobium sp. NFR06 TaxID=1566290 RepID=UPI0008E420B8|nr:SMI1/KNR4 family protein [Mesorhizobium sp. NFR06]SFN86683.1 SMI1 / KNR4 family (SUKH-1) [Mesorhizobium sp. NFR06]
MAKDIRARLQALVSKLYQVREEFYQVAFGQSADQVLGPPASEQQLQAFERSLGYALPPSYREMLLLHDGWVALEDEADLLSLAQRHEEEIRDRVKSFKKMMREGEDPYNQDNLLVVGGADSTFVVYLDIDTLRADGEMDVVEYTYEEGELARHKDIVAYLKSNYDEVRQWIKDEKGADAGPDPEE